MLVIDAFSGDAIPVHLLTREAVALYLQRLKPNGILAIHTSNTYLDLNPVVKLLADDAGVESRLISNSDDERKLIDAADWMLLTRNQDFLLKLDETELQDSIEMPPKLRVWTDDYNNLFQILRPLKFLNKGNSESPGEIVYTTRAEAAQYDISPVSRQLLVYQPSIPCFVLLSQSECISLRAEKCEFDRQGATKSG